MKKHKPKFQNGELAIYTPKEGQPMEAEVLGFRPEYDFYTVKIKGDHILVDGERLSRKTGT